MVAGQNLKAQAEKDNMCLYPNYIQNRKYTATKKNGGVIPPLPYIKIDGKMVLDSRVLLVPVQCGKCMECMKKTAREWQIRLKEEIKDDNTGVFVTLTFSDQTIARLGKEINQIKTVIGKKITTDKNGKERNRYIYKIEELENEIKGYDRDNAIAKLGVKRFLENWRKRTGKSVKHWLVTELGHEGTENIHLHGILFTKESDEMIKECWKDFVWIEDVGKRYVSERTVNYTTKYINKTDFVHENYKPVVLTSAGIGKGYVKREGWKHTYKGKNTNQSYTNEKGYKMGLPLYLKNKLWKDEEKEKMWQELLNEEVRYVGGERIDISKGEENYENVREYYRKKNIELGYGNDKKNWNKVKYENERRNMNYMTRKIKGEKKRDEDNN